jgi:hypothetical protein
LHLFTSWKSSSWAVKFTEATLSCLCIHLQGCLQFFQCYHAHAIECAGKAAAHLKIFKILLSSPPHCSHNSCPVRAFPHSSWCPIGKDFNVTEHFMYFLYYRSCFWVLVRYSMAYIYLLTHNSILIPFRILWYF